jgi:radical SAM superfamily enzyme YgiQ (UPF0313 family)
MTKPDIYFIQPPGWAVENPPMGLAMLKSYLASKNIVSSVCDININLYNLRSNYYSKSWELANGYYTWERQNWINKFFQEYTDEILDLLYSVIAREPKVVGVSVHSSTYLSSILLSQELRKYSQDTKIMFGGPEMIQTSPKWKDVLLKRVADVIVFGEGERTVLNYLTGDDTKGTAYLNNNNEIIIGGTQPTIPNLDELPFPDYSGFNLKLYRGTNVLPTYFSRGCINNCLYCTERNYFPKFRCRSGKRVFDEIVYQKQLYPKTEYFRIQDSVSNGNIKELNILCDLLIENNIEIGFSLEGAVIRKEMETPLYKKLHKAGCTVIGYGLETPSKPLLKKTGKLACQSADFDTVIMEGVKSGITMGINFMFGLPGETEEESQMQLEFIRKYKRYRKHIILNPALNYCYLPPGCNAYENPDMFDIDLSKGSLFWESKDGSSTFPIRLMRFERFCKLAESLGYENLFGITESVNRDEMLQIYYGNVEQETNRDIPWNTGFNTRQELEQNLLHKNISETINRLNEYAEQTYEPSAKIHWNIPALKKYLKHTFSKWVYKNDKQYISLIHTITALDNKLTILGGVKEK